MSFCLGSQHCRVEVGEWRDKKKAYPKLLISSKVVKNNHLEELFHRVPRSVELY